MAAQFKVSDNVAHRTNRTAETRTVHPTDYEKQIYEQGLKYYRPQFTFQASQWQIEAEKLMSADSVGYVSGNAGTGETARKNREAFQKWSIVSLCLF